CASLDLTGHGIAAPPTLDMPEPWLSLLAHYQRRKPEQTQMREGYAALAASLPELDGIRMTLLGLHHSQGGSALHVLVQGQIPEPRPGPLDIDLNLPLSLWLREAGGRWHAARPGRCPPARRESAKPPTPGAARAPDRPPAGAAAGPARGRGRGGGRRAVGRGPRRAAAPLEVPLVTD